MAANAIPKLSTITSPDGAINPDAISSPAVAIPEDPPVQVKEQANGMVLVKWGDGGAKQTLATAGTDYPSLFSVVDTNGDEPLVKTYGTLLGCDGGTLTIGETRYRIRVKQEQQQANANQVAELLEFVRNEKDDRTKNKEMSKASTDWAESILAAYHVKHHRMKEVVHSVGSFEDPQPYKWTVRTTEGETWNKGEHGGTPGALAWLKEFFLSSSSLYDLKEVTGAKLPRVHGNRKSATGKSDILIGAAKDIHKGSTFDFAMGLVELKTDKYPLKLGQNLLQLLSLSLASSFEKAVVALATDCDKQWELFYFSDVNTITSKVYDHGSKAWDDFLQLLDSTSQRDYVGTSLWIPSLPQVAEQDLAGFDMSDRDKKKAKAEEDEIMLQHFADQLGDIYGERPTVPWWARANARVPDYYA